jgi:hypothetical protein
VVELDGRTEIGFFGIVLEVNRVQLVRYEI